MPKRTSGGASGSQGKKARVEPPRSGPRASLESAHHVLVQALLKERYMLEDEARKVYLDATANVGGEDFDERAYQEYWRVINKELDFVGLGLRRTKYRHDGRLYVGIVNKVADDAAKAAGSQLTSNELSMFRLIVEEINTNCPDGELPAMQAINVRLPDELEEGATQAQQTQFMHTQHVANMGSSAKEAALLKMEAEGWIANDDGIVTLGVRTYLELEDLLSA